MNHKEHVEASVALISWFKSQGIDPADAHCVMSIVSARQIAHKCKNLDQVKDAIGIVTELLVVHIREEIKGD